MFWEFEAQWLTSDLKCAELLQLAWLVVAGFEICEVKRKPGWDCKTAI